MNSLEMVVLIVAIVAFAGIMKARYAARDDTLAEPDPVMREDTLRQRAEIARLKERVTVLERILTDRSADLSEEIERLRDRT